MLLLVFFFFFMQKSACEILLSLVGSEMLIRDRNVNYAVKVGYVRTLLSSVDPSNNVQVLPARKDDLAALAKRIEGSVLMVIAQ